MHDDGAVSPDLRTTGADPSSVGPGTLPPLRSTLLPPPADLPMSARSLSLPHPTSDRSRDPSSSWRSVTEAGFSPSAAGPRPAGFLGTGQRWASPWAPGAAAGPLPAVRRGRSGPSLAVTVAVSAVVAAVVGGLVGGAVAGFGSQRVVRRIVERPSPALSGAPADLSGLARGALPSVVLVGREGAPVGTVSVAGPASHLPGAPVEAFVTPVGPLRRAVQSAEARGQRSWRSAGATAVLRPEGLPPARSGLG